MNIIIGAALPPGVVLPPRALSHHLIKKTFSRLDTTTHNRQSCDERREREGVGGKRG